MSSPDPSDPIASISKTILLAATSVHSALSESSATVYNRYVLFASKVFSPSGREKIASAAAKVPQTIADDPAKFTLAWAVGASVFAGGLVATPRVSRLFRLCSADRIRALIFGCTAVTASGAAATASSMCIMQQPSNFTSTVRASTSSQPASEAGFSWVWPPLPSAEVALLCGALSLLTFRVSGGRGRYLLPSDLCVRTMSLPVARHIESYLQVPGPFSRPIGPASPGTYASDSEKSRSASLLALRPRRWLVMFFRCSIAATGAIDGCHHCGTRSSKQVC